MNDRTSAYRCKLSPPYNQGSIQLGRSKKDVEILEQSRESFTARVSAQLANAICAKKSLKFFYQGTAWLVTGKNRWLDETGQCLIELACLQELGSARQGRGNSLTGNVRLQSASHMDGTYAAIFLTVMAVCILIMPAWGGKWGTSQIICDFVSNVWVAFTSLIPGGRNLR